MRKFRGGGGAVVVANVPDSEAPMPIAGLPGLSLKSFAPASTNPGSVDVRLLVNVTPAEQLVVRIAESLRL